MATSKVIAPFIIGDSKVKWGGYNNATLDPRFLDPGETYDSLNWITGRNQDYIALRRGQQTLGQTTRNGDPVTGLAVGTRRDGNQVPAFTYDEKIMYYDYNLNDTKEINTANVFSNNGQNTTFPAKGENISITPYQNLAGSFLYFTSPNSSMYKMNVANPGDVVDQQEYTYRFIFMRIFQSRSFAVGRKGNTQNSTDPTGVYLSYTDRQLLSNYPAATNQSNLFTCDGVTKTYTGTLTVPSKNTIFYVSISTVAATETFYDDGNGNLTSNLGGTGKINYVTGVFTVTFNTVPINQDTGTSTFNTEDATSTGICDFSFNTTTRVPFSGELLRQDDAGGNAQAIFPFNGVEYCFHVLKSWQLTLSTDDKTFQNLPYYEQIGIPCPRAAFPKGDGILFLDNSNPGSPSVSILQIPQASTNLTVVPIKLSEDLDLSSFGFSNCAIFSWGDYDIISCQSPINGVLPGYNNLTFVRNIYSGIWDKLDYTINVMDIYQGTLISGDSLSPNLNTLFSGFDDNGGPIQNHRNSSYTDLNIPGMKKVGYFNLQGLIQPSQQIQISYSLDNGPYVTAYTISGSGSYVSKSSPVGIGSFTIGSNVLGGGGAGGTAVANQFEIDIPVHTDLFEFISWKVEALNVGYVQINKFQYKDIRFKRRRIISYDDQEINN